MTDWSNYTDPIRAITIGWGNSEQGVKAPEAHPQANRVILSYLVSHKGISLMDIAEDRGIPHERLNSYYQGNDKALTMEDEGRLTPLVKEVAQPEAEYIRGERALGRKPRRTLYHDLRDAGYDIEKSFGVKL